MNRSVVIDRKFAERTSREKKMIAARRSPVFSTVSRPSLISPVTHDAYSQLKIIIVQKRTRTELLKYIEESIAVINGYC